MPFITKLCYHFPLLQNTYLFPSSFCPPQATPSCGFYQLHVHVYPSHEKYEKCSTATRFGADGFASLAFLSHMILQLCVFKVESSYAWRYRHYEGLYLTKRVSGNMTSSLFHWNESCSQYKGSSGRVIAKQGLNKSSQVCHSIINS